MRFSGKERDVESGLDYFGARYHASFYYRWLSVDPSMNKEEALINPQLWNLYSFCHDNPVTHFDSDGREVIRYNDPKLQILVESLAASSKRIRDTLALFQGKGTPDLEITYGDAGDSRDLGKFSCATTHDGGTGEYRLDKAKITIDTSLYKKKRETKKTLRHEIGHSDQTVRDPEEYDAEYKKGLEMKYEDRPVEKYANEYARLSKKEKLK